MTPFLPYMPEHPRRGGRGELDPALERDLPVDDALVHAGPSGARPSRCRSGSSRSPRAPGPSGPSCRTGSGRWRPSGGRWCAAPATCGAGAPRPASAAASSTPTWRPRSPRGAPELLLEREVEVLRARLAEHVLAAVAGRGDLLDGLLRAHVHDVERGAGEVGEHDRAVRRLLLHLPGAGDAVVVRVGLARLERAAATSTSMAGAVLRVHHRQQRRCRRAFCMARRIWPSSE